MASILIAYGKPRYIAIPLEDVQFVDVSESHVPLIRMPRRAIHDQITEQDGRIERQAHHDAHDYVDYGAHTGHHGAFGWYADFPVLKHH